jgi:hypothetical protein
VNAERQLRLLTDAEQRHIEALGLATGLELTAMTDRGLSRLLSWQRGGVAIQGSKESSAAVAAFVRLIEAEQQRRTRSAALVELEVDDVDEEGALASELPPDYFDGLEAS